MNPAHIASRNLTRSDIQIAALVDQVGLLPLTSPVVALLDDLLNDPLVTIAEIARGIAIDPTTAMRVLRAANSAYFGAAESVADLTRAIQLMGFEAVRDSVDAMSLLRLFAIRLPSAPLINAQLNGLWRHSVATGVAARLLARRGDTADAMTAFAAGLLHDIGKAGLILLKTTDYAVTVQVATSERLTLAQAERQTLGFDHTALGRQLCMAWGQPEDICAAVGRHHTVRAGGVHEVYSTLTAIVHVADILARALGVGWWGDRVMPRLDSAASVALDLQPDDAHALLEALDEEYPHVLAYLSSMLPDTIVSHLGE